MNNNILIEIVEDDAAIRNLLTVSLKTGGYKYLTAVTGESAMSMAASNNPDILLLDIGLPDLDGIEVIRRIRQWSQLPIIVISARTDDKDKIEALDAGADDYLTKPFSVEEMMARIRVAQRRILSSGGAGWQSPVFKNGALTIDYSAGCAYIDGKELKLTPIEYKLLCLLAKNVGKVLTHNYLTQSIWGASWDSNIASLRVFMNTLRKKLEAEPDSPRYIQTHVGIGYRMLKL